jgi:glycosyltransferase involved in cell wall biosynthesis
MKIAMVAPLAESVPPKLYGGTERVVSFLTEELVRQGHQVTLFASGDSLTSARLHAVVPTALRLAKCKDPLAHHVRLIECVARNIHEFDVVHFHVDYLHYPLMRLLQAPHVTTLHGRLDLPDLVPIYRDFYDMPVVSISDAQRNPLPFVNWRATVYNGIPRELLRFHPRPGEYLAFLGRISPEKRVDRAIEIAVRTGIPLKIAAKIDSADNEYFETEIKGLMDHPLVEYIGEIGDHEKEEFLGNAKALLFPIDWPEPFGLVMIESMACGTPVIAWPCGSVPEIMKDGVTGYIVDDMDAAVAALERLDSVERSACRRHFEKYFTATKMAQDYAAVYRATAENTSASRPRMRL